MPRMDLFWFAGGALPPPRRTSCAPCRFASDRRWRSRWIARSARDDKSGGEPACDKHRATERAIHLSLGPRGWLAWLRRVGWTDRLLDQTRDASRARDDFLCDHACGFLHEQRGAH